MRIANESIEKVTTVFNGLMRIFKAYCIGPVENPVENDYFNSDMSNIFSDEDVLISENEYIELKNGRKYKCFYHDLVGSGIGLDLSNIVRKKEVNDKALLFTNIRCLKDEKVIIRLGRWGGRTGNIKVWVNNTAVHINSRLWIDTYVVFLELKKGDNIVFIESNSSYVSMRVNTYEDDLSGLGGDVFKDYFNNEVLDNVIIIQEKFDLSNADYHDFLVIPKDFVNITCNKLSITVKDEEDRVYDMFEAKLNEKIRYDISKIRCELKDSIFLKFEIKYVGSCGVENKIEDIVIADINLWHAQYGKIIELYQSCENRFALTDDDKMNIEGRIRDLDINQYSAKSDFFMDESCFFRLLINERKVMLQIISYIQDGLHFEDYIGNYVLKGGNFNIYYKSKLDGSIQNYIIHVPKNYCKDKIYGLVLLPRAWDIASVQCINHKKLKDFENEDVVIATIPTRGITLGSYIGEVAIMENIQKILDVFSIDEDRIYLTGFSNGAYVCWLLAQSYPHMFAAIVPFCGAPYSVNLLNLTNINILNICTEKDVINNAAFHIPSETLGKKSSCYKSLLVKEAHHMTAITLFNSGHAVEWLLKHKKVRFPKKIYFRTERMRHNKTHWLEIVSFEEGKKYCELEGELLDNSIIELRLTNIKQFILTIPECINGDRLEIRINKDNLFTFTGLQKDKLIFENTDNGYILLDDIDMAKARNSSLGMGLLDIYMDSMKIVLPSVYSSETEEKILTNVAKSFAQPESYGTDTTIFANYPIINEDVLTARDIQESNLIIIGTGENNKFISSIKAKLPFTFDANGYEYKGKYIEGDYCILLLHANPLNTNKKVLLAYTNNCNLFVESIITQKFVIPSYFNGVHPILNSDVVIFDGNDYYTVDVIGNDIVRLT